MFSIMTLFIGSIALFVIVMPMAQNILRLRQLGQAQRTTIDIAVAGDVVAVEGTAAPSDQLLTAPLTDTACLFWRLEVQEWQRRGKSSRWVTIFNQHSTQPFGMSDGIRRIQIHPAEGDLQIERDYRAANTFFSGLDDMTRLRLERIGIETQNWLGFNKSLRVYEAILTPGDQICVMGSIDYVNGVSTLRQPRNGRLLLADGTIQSLKSKLWSSVLLSSLLLVFVVAFLAVLVGMRIF